MLNILIIVKSLLFGLSNQANNKKVNSPINDEHDGDASEPWHFEEMKHSVLIVQMIRLGQRLTTFLKFVEYFLLHLFTIYFGEFLQHLNRLVDLATGYVPTVRINEIHTDYKTYKNSD